MPRHQLARGPCLSADSQWAQRQRFLSSSGNEGLTRGATAAQRPGNEGREDGQPRPPWARAASGMGLRTVACHPVEILSQMA
mmetsp:Transcript_71313/g.225300  ORF Transcript_71313/g.225300 Transcript_71313/m.225300 type:complete len:82 (-) Transcript_71313:18-263(-)